MKTRVEKPENQNTAFNQAMGIFNEQARKNPLFSFINFMYDMMVPKPVQENKEQLAKNKQTTLFALATASLAADKFTASGNSKFREVGQLESIGATQEEVDAEEEKTLEEKGGEIQDGMMNNFASGMGLGIQPTPLGFFNQKDEDEDEEEEAANSFRP